MVGSITAEVLQTSIGAIGKVQVRTWPLCCLLSYSASTRMLSRTPERAPARLASRAEGCSCACASLAAQVMLKLQFSALSGVVSVLARILQGISQLTDKEKHSLSLLQQWLANHSSAAPGDGDDLPEYDDDEQAAEYIEAYTSSTRHSGAVSNTACNRF